MKTDRPFKRELLRARSRTLPLLFLMAGRAASLVANNQVYSTRVVYAGISPTNVRNASSIMAKFSKEMKERGWRFPNKASSTIFYKRSDAVDWDPAAEADAARFATIGQRLDVDVIFAVLTPVNTKNDQHSSRFVRLFPDGADEDAGDAGRAAGTTD